jgi:hypothetical protein
MATKINFDRDAVGVIAKTQWNDAEDLAQIGRAVARITSVDSVAFPLPSPAGEGAQALRDAAKHFNRAMELVIFEYSDAASCLGSGVETAGSNFDETENYNRERAAKLGVDWNR